jgi:hypothetical protein
LEPLTQLLAKVGLDAETVLATAGAVYLLVEWFKRKFPITQGFGTQIAAFIISCGVSALLILPNWPGAVTLAVVAWFIPDAFHQTRMNTAETKNNHTS